MGFRDTLELLTKEFERMISTRTVVGEPFTVGNVTLIPITSAMVGLGGGGGEGTAGKDQPGGAGEGVGAGFRVTPVGVVVIKGDEVTLLPVGRKGSFLEKLVEVLPGLASKFGDKVKDKVTQEAAKEGMGNRESE
jgi:uncharacterized spore protein YtfJ